MEKIILWTSLLLLLFTTKKSAGQESSKSSKNYIGILGGVEWNTQSGAVGLEYERIVHTIGQFVFSVKGIYVFRYKYENLSLNIGGNSYINNQSVSHMLLLGNARFFTNREKINKGVYFNSGLGLGICSLQYDTGINSSQHVDDNNVKGGFELGMGYIIKLNRGLSLGLSSSAIWGTFEGAFTSAKISFGFI